MSEVQSKLFPYKNKNLFSRHYLTDRLERTSIWDVDDEELEDAYDELRRIYEEQKEFLPHTTNNEVEVRNEFVNPILRKVLNFKKQQEAKSGNSQKVPDYALYDTSEKKAKALETEDYYENAIGILEAKAWKKDLEKKTATGDPSTDDSNPTKQIVSYLIENKPQWGILTNGKKWRLVNRDASDRLDTYYEVDIENLLTSDGTKKERLEDFKYFYIFFRKQAFQGNEGDKLLDELLDESLRYAEDIGEDLEESIYRALEWLAKGYLENGSNTGIEDEPIGRIHDNSLIYLYRLLFALYADSRGILGDPGGKYEYYNFSALVNKVSEELDQGDGYGKTGRLRNRLDAIFRMIDEGSQSQDIPKDEADIPAYNGGLFNQDKHEFLKEYNLHDEYLAKVIDLVARTEREEGGRAQVDYYDLSVRHLGGIYEGLLEYQLEKADEDMVEVKEGADKIVKTVEESEGDGDKILKEIDEGHPYLVTDDGERKATGSYYTPDYIVKYIVENTVGPKLEKEIEGLETDEEKAQAILDLQILDPAMGSAHFLVEVIDYLATELVDYKSIEPDQAKREVANRCIYGVDVNRLATELGKVSIWLKTISEDKPLSFLNHHIKTGNSLIGADIHDINRHPEEDEESERQVTIGEEFGEENAGVVRANVQEMLKKFKEIQEKQADSPEDIKEQEELYQEFLDFPFRKRFDILADVYTSHYFDNDYKVDDYNRLLQAFKLQEQKEEGDEEWNQVIKEDFVQKATDSLDNSHEEDNTSSQKGFFHWKLEFPEVFFDIEEGIEKENSGFDAVVGNPPYVKIQNIPQEVRDYLEEIYEVTEERYDLYGLFTERGLELSKSEFGYILPSKFFESKAGAPLRKYLRNRRSIREIDSFEEYQIFDGVTTYTCLLFLSKDQTESFKVRKAEDEKVTEKFALDSFDSFELDYSHLQEKWDLTNPKKLQVVDRVKGFENSLEDIFESIYVGIQTSANDIFYVDKISEDRNKIKCETASGVRELEEELLHPILLGKDIKRFKGPKDDRLMIYPYKKEDGKTKLIEEDELRDNYPKIYDYLSEHKDVLSDRGTESQEYESWYAHWCPRNFDRKEKEKLLTPDVSMKGQFSYDPEGKFFFSNSAYSLVLEDDSYNYFDLMAILNSKLSDFFLVQTAPTLRGGYHRNNTQYLFPITAPENVDSNLLEVSKKIYEKEKKSESEKNDFLEWVEAEWSVNIDNLSLKTHMREYWAHDFDEFMRIAKKNKSQIDGNVKSREFRELMKDEWENSMLTLEPLMNKIDELENEIDAIVFDLYDLTEEEVETVLDSLDTPEGEKASILEKFEEVSSRSPISSPQV